MVIFIDWRIDSLLITPYTLPRIDWGAAVKSCQQ